MQIQPSFGTETYTPDHLIAGDTPGIVTKTLTLLSGENRARGTVLGMITKGAASGAKQSGTGDGTIGAVTLGKQAKVGTYVLTCIAADTDAGTFQVVDPDGYALADLTVGVAYTSDHINLTVGDGAADWGVGAIIHVTVAAGSGKLKMADYDAVDGSAEPYGILVEDTDASGGDKECSVYISGCFDFSELTYGATYNTLAELGEMIEILREHGIIIKTDTQSA